MSLPEDIGSLEELRVLNIRSNNLTLLPSSLKDLFKLNVQNAVENNIDEDLITALKLKGPKCQSEFL